MVDIIDMADGIVMMHHHYMPYGDLLPTVPCVVHLAAACPQTLAGYTFVWGVDHGGSDIACSSASRTIATVAADCNARPDCAGFSQFTSTHGGDFDCMKTSVSAPVPFPLVEVLDDHGNPIYSLGMSPANVCHGTFTKGGDVRWRHMRTLLRTLALAWRAAVLAVARPSWCEHTMTVRKSSARACLHCFMRAHWWACVRSLNPPYSQPV